MTSTINKVTDNQQHHYHKIDGQFCQAVAIDWAKDAVAQALSIGTLHEWAYSQTEKETLQGRGCIYSVMLASVPPTPVVVRRNMHGGLLRILTGEYFFAPTRAPLELEISLRLTTLGVPTPQIIAYAIYPTAGLFAKSDIMTRRLPAGCDLPEAWAKADKIERKTLLKSVAKLLLTTAAAGAWHADLNLKNIYIAKTDYDMTAYLLDVDRVTFPQKGNVAKLNFSRLVRSAQKWRTHWELDFSEEDISNLAMLVEEKKTCE